MVAGRWQRKRDHRRAHAMKLLEREGGELSIHLEVPELGAIPH